MRDHASPDGSHSSATTTDAPAPGRRSLTQSLQRRAAPGTPAAPATVATGSSPALQLEATEDPFGAHLLGDPVQRAVGPGAVTDDPGAVHQIADGGVAGGGGALPYLDTISRSFGPAHDVSGIEAFVGGPAASAAGAIGAEAYATGNKVAFKSSPDLHTAAHEAAHVVQQRAGVHLRGGIGEAGDVHERHADAVADRVVRGEPAGDLLAQYHGGGGAPAVQRQEGPGSGTQSQASGAEGEGGEAAPGGADSIEGQLAAGGIHVVLARQSVEADIAPMAAAMMSRARAAHPPTTLGQALAANQHTIGQTGPWRELNGRSQEEKDAPLTEAQATLLATGKMHNNREFMNQAPRAAAAHHAVGGTPDAPQVGRAIPFLNTDDPLALVEAMSVAVRDHFGAPGGTGTGATGATGAAPAEGASTGGAAPGAAPASGSTATPTPAASGEANPSTSAPRRRRAAHVVPRTANIAEISIFTHGSHSSIELGSLGWANAGTVSARLGPLLAPNVRINLYACSAASGDDSFAERLAENLARDEANPHTADVFGHTTYGNTATLAAGRHFHADAGAGAEATSHTNWQLIFDAAFLTEQATAIHTTLVGDHEGLTVAQVEAAIRNDNCGPRWLATAMQRATVTMPGRRGEQNLPASFAIGMEPARATEAVRALWRQPEEGVAAVRRQLDRAASGGRRRRH